jgi:hypothetical protein
MLRKIHLILGLLVSLPVLGWSISGFFLALPPAKNSSEAYQAIEVSKVLLTSADALRIANDQLGPGANITSLSLEQRGGSSFYSVFGSGGALRIDATTGQVRQPVATPTSTNLLRHAHFYNFAGRWRTMILLLLSALSACSTLTGLMLFGGWLARDHTVRR